MDTHPLLPPVVLLEQDTNQFYFQQENSTSLILPCFPPTICLPHRSVKSHRSSQREREHCNRLVNTSSHPPTKNPISQLNRNVWEDRRGIKCCRESKTLVLLASTFPLNFVTLVMFYATLLHFQEQSWKL